jgi:hypothetical protein
MRLPRQVVDEVYLAEALEVHFQPQEDLQRWANRLVWVKLAAVEESEDLNSWCFYQETKAQQELVVVAV